MRLYIYGIFLSISKFRENFQDRLMLLEIELDIKVALGILFFFMNFGVIDEVEQTGELFEDGKEKTKFNFNG